MLAVVCSPSDLCAAPGLPLNQPPIIPLLLTPDWLIDCLGLSAEVEDRKLSFAEQARSTSLSRSMSSRKALAVTEPEEPQNGTSNAALQRLQSMTQVWTGRGGA